jgi:hypothetical protein
MKPDWKLPKNYYAFKDLEGKELCELGDTCALVKMWGVDEFIQPATNSRPRYKDGWLHFDQVDDFMQKVKL